MLYEARTYPSAPPWCSEIRFAEINGDIMASDIDWLMIHLPSSSSPPQPSVTHDLPGSEDVGLSVVH